MPRFRRLALLVSCSLLLPATALDARASVNGVPDLRLIRSTESVRLIRYGRGPVVLDLNVYLASLGAPFEIRARRATYDDPIRAWQVIHGSGDARSVRLPDDLLEGWSGLADLFEVDVSTVEGVPLRHKTFSFCPNAYEVVRVSDTGPLQPAYPYGCGTHPFTMGAVWGIDEGWAVETLSWERPMTMRLRDGTYIATIRVAPRYVDLFGMAPEETTAEVRIRVVTQKGCCEYVAARDAAPHRAERLGPASSTDARRLTPIATVESPDAATVPDLVALPSFGITPVSQRGRDFLAFGANVWNRGPAPLLVEGFRRPGEDSMEAFQYFTRRGRVVGKAPVGTFDFHDRRGHHHWHFEHFAGYRLLDASGVQAVRSRKQSFCLAPTDPIDTTVRGATWRPDELGFSACGGPEALWIRETLPVGWGDTYFQYVAGQSFDITDLPNGTYFIEVRANPLGLLHDRDPSNDTVVREVILGGGRGSRTATVPLWHGIDSEGGFGFFG